MVRGGESAMASRKRRSMQAGLSAPPSPSRPTKPAAAAAAAAGAVVERGLNPLQGFRRGNIVSVRMKSFVTFTDATILPTPRLNLIVGPNGSGKSTVVSAVCVCLGGKLNLLGRSAELGQYVRHGCEKAEVEVRLFDPEARGGTRSVKRVFGGQDGKTVAFHVDGKSAKMRDVEAVRERYDVQLDNLAQFMPQEKIAEFCNQTEDELLIRTVRALGGTAMSEKYDELCGVDVMVEKAQGEVEKKESILKELVLKNQALEEDVRAYAELQEVRRKARMCERFVPHIRFIASQDEFRELKADSKTYEAEVAKQRAEADASKGPLLDCQRKRDAAWKKYHQVERKRVKHLDNDVTIAVNNLEDAADAIETVHDEMEQQRKGVARKASELEKLEAKLDECQRRFNAAVDADGGGSAGGGADERAKAAIAALQTERQSLRQEKSECSRRIVIAERTVRDVGRHIKTLHTRTQGVLDVRSARLAQLETQSRKRGLGQFTAWVAENQGHFRGRVHGPVALEVDCENEYHGRILATCIPEWAQASFVVECKEDGDRLRSAASHGGPGFKVATMSVPLNRDGEWDMTAVHHPNRSVDARLQSLGIQRCVSEIYTAPEAVKAALHAQFGFQHMHVGDDLADRTMDQLITERNMSCWFTPSRVYKCRTSRYNQASRSTAVNDLRRCAGLFGQRTDGADRQRAEIHALLQVEEAKYGDAKGQLDTIRQEIKNIDNRDVELRAKVQKHQEAVNGRRNLQKAVVDTQRRLATARADNTSKSLARKAAELDKKLEKCESLVVCTTQELVKAMTALAQGMARLDESLAVFSSADRAYKAEERMYDDSTRALTDLEENLAQLKNRVGEMRQRLRQEKEDAFKSVGQEELEGEHKEFYDCLGELTLDDIEARIEQLRDKAGRMTNTGGAVVKQFEDNKCKIEGIKRDLAEIRATHEERRTTFEAEKTEFTTWLVRVMDGMAFKFSELFQGLGCRGDIRLSNADSARLADLKIEIMVSFRDDVDLRPVSQNSNSGGEKMATTMLYCFALQAQEENRNPPFVMIDELNQGLDPKNERYIMTLMMQQAENESTPQSFVVTPKLIMRLPVGKSTSCHIIMNGLVNVPRVLQAGSA